MLGLDQQRRAVLVVEQRESRGIVVDIYGLDAAALSERELKYSRESLLFTFNQITLRGKSKIGLRIETMIASEDAFQITKVAKVGELQKKINKLGYTQSPFEGT